jgi:hypothetical protein
MKDIQRRLKTLTARTDIARLPSSKTTLPNHENEELGNVKLAVAGFIGAVWLGRIAHGGLVGCWPTTALSPCKLLVRNET